MGSKCLLNQPFTVSDVKMALDQVAGWKSPGPDGIPTAFYQQEWSWWGRFMVDLRCSWYFKSPISSFLCFLFMGLADLHDGVSLEGSSVDLMHLKIRLTSFGFIPLSMKPMDVVPLVLPINMFRKTHPKERIFSNAKMELSVSPHLLTSPCTSSSSLLLKTRVRVSQSTFIPPRFQQLPLCSAHPRHILSPMDARRSTVTRASLVEDNGYPRTSSTPDAGKVSNFMFRFQFDPEFRLWLYILDFEWSNLILQLASHGLFDVHVRATGDIHIDDHHTNEDVALAIGTALLHGLGDRKGINRFGDFSAPLDEALIHVSLDLSGRPHLSYDLCIPTERVGTYDTQLVKHFFQSLVNTSGMTLHIRQLAGKNSHRIIEATCIIEATFKAFARALRQATEYDPRRCGTVPRRGGSRGSTTWKNALWAHLRNSEHACTMVKHLFNLVDPDHEVSTLIDAGAKLWRVPLVRASFFPADIVHHILAINLPHNRDRTQRDEMVWWHSKDCREDQFLFPKPNGFRSDDHGRCHKGVVITDGAWDIKDMHSSIGRVLAEEEGELLEQQGRSTPSLLRPFTLNVWLAWMR
ncbi:hypothetical protein RHSIM_Rhsim02G0025200 [Rhododendron simsii]|uniref:imidazoleglycerol-phosphate dehydratase n=1 Tax=Rhododendron simsii TaxID=118357 RepID=A0A834HEJ2_RHOSS|nr:hypothetical protein RHSIM_Rhsim02G0025200 [Rhododendron simsii]